MHKHPSELEKDSTSNKHSVVGVVAFIIAELLFTFLLIFVALDVLDGQESMNEQFQEIGRVFFRWFYFLLPLSCVLSIVGMSNRYRRKIFGAMALGTNVLSVILVATLFILGD